MCVGVIGGVDGSILSWESTRYLYFMERVQQINAPGNHNNNENNNNNIPYKLWGKLCAACQGQILGKSFPYSPLGNKKYFQ